MMPSAQAVAIVCCDCDVRQLCNMLGTGDPHRPREPKRLEQCRLGLLHPAHHHGMVLVPSGIGVWPLHAALDDHARWVGELDGHCSTRDVRSLYRCSLPLSVWGNASRNSTLRGYF